MNQNLDRTAAIGNAFMSQQQNVLDTVQDLRQRAQAQGNLVTTPQQRVVVQQGNIEIVPANLQVIYVPAYNPAVVYGPWWYPAYPPYVWYPGVAVGVGISFGIGFFVGAAVASWSGFNWVNRSVNVNLNRTTVFNNVNIHNVNVHTDWQRWEHNERYGRFTTPTGSTKQSSTGQFQSFHGQSTSRSIQKREGNNTQLYQQHKQSKKQVKYDKTLAGTKGAEVTHSSKTGQHSHSEGTNHESGGSHSTDNHKH
jgi:hypothetical protein